MVFLAFPVFHGVSGVFGVYVELICNYIYHYK